MTPDQKGFINPLVLLLTVALLTVVGFAGYKVYQANYASETAAVIVVEETQKIIPGNPFTFTAAGDFNSNENADLVLRGIGASGSDFTLALGDLGYGGNGTEQEWCDFTKARVGNDHPFEIVAGNHDDGSRDGDILEYRKCLPDKLGTVRGNYGLEYYFDYNNLARFILISPDIDNYGYDYTKGLEHYEWVSERIDEARTKGLQWVILGMHKNCITPGVKSCEIGEDIINLAVEKGVNLVLQGHEHSYFRSKQLGFSSECTALVVNTVNESCISGEGDQLISSDGTVIVISGAGGYKLRDVDLDDPEIGYFETWNAANTGNTYGFSEFYISSESVSARFNPVGSGLYKDSFGINSSAN